MKIQIAKTLVVLAALTAIGCSSYSPDDDMYGDRSRCHGEIEVSSSVTIYSTDAEDTGKTEITEKCVPNEPGMLTDFEKENQKQDID